MSTSQPFRRSHANAVVLRWQATVRLGVIVVLALSWGLFRLLVPPRAPSLGARALGDPGYLLAFVALLAAYLALVFGQAHWLRRADQARGASLVTVVTADTALLLGAVWLIADPGAYPRSLLLGLLTLQLTQLHFGRRLVAYAAGLMAAGYVGLVLLARAAGAPLVLAEELWSVYLFLVGAAGVLVFQGGLVHRLRELAGLFRLVEEGDFSRSYDTARDRWPDHVTAVGHAYNRMRSQLATIVLTDPLSGCLNRRGFEARLASEVARAVRGGGALALLAVDVDHFKQINDTFGHLAGDAAIAEVGRLLRETVRRGDVVARIGGEEFMILAPDTLSMGAVHLAERVVTAFRAHAFAAVEMRLPITASVGVVAERHPTEGVAEDLRARADEALYAAKRSGRDRVVLWSPGLASEPAPPGASPAAAIPKRLVGIGRRG